MKYIITILTIFSFFGCNRNDIQGEWIVVEQTFKNCDVNNDNRSIQNIQSSPCNESSPSGCHYEIFQLFNGIYTGEKIKKESVGLISITQYEGSYLSSSETLKICEKECIEYNIIQSDDQLEMTSQTTNEDGCIVFYVLNRI